MTPLTDANMRLRMLSRQLMEVQEPERCAVVRDLHHEIGQVLPITTLNLHDLGQQPKRPDAASITTQISDSFQILDHVLHSIRSLALNLKAPHA